MPYHPAMRYPTQWIRLAGNARAIKEGSRKAWRCFLADGTLIELTGFRQTGTASGRNTFYRTVLDHPEMADGLSAWIDMYGTLSVEDGEATLELENPA